MYRYKENKGFGIKNFFILTLIMILVSILSILIYNMYLGIEVTNIRTARKSRSSKTFTNSRRE